ncbi:MAG TPA: gamma-glutamyltransferase, partial [Reyranella sp.]
MVAAAHPLAAAAGARVLSNGGNAFDAAAATAATLNVVEPYMSGLAGEGYATCYVAAERRVRSLNFMARIPRRFPLDKLSRREQILRGPVAVGAPGNFGGWAEMVRSYGTKKLPELFAPAIRIARDGFGMIEFNVEEYRGVTGELRGHAALYPEWSRNYVEGIEGGQPGLGALLKQPNLANTLEALGNEGPGLLYGGALGKKIVDRLTELGGCLGMDDLADFKAEWVEPVAVTYRGRTIHVPPPPCEAFQYLVTLRILEGFDLGKMERNGVEHVDTVLRAIRIAAGVRIANGVPTAQKLAELLSDGHIESLRARVRDGKPVTGPTEQWTPLPKDGQGSDRGEGHTTSFSIADAQGNVVCV